MPRPRQNVVFADEPEQLPTYEDLIASSMQNPSPPAEPAPPAEPPAEPTPAEPPNEPPNEETPPPAPKEEPDLTDPEGENNGGAPQPTAPPRNRDPSRSRKPPISRSADNPAIVDPQTLDGEIITPSGAVYTPVYESRITILAAWQYPGNVNAAPAWIDRNWIGYETNYDPVRNLEGGPVLRIPSHNDPSSTTSARVGDYVVQQEMKVAPTLTDIRVEVWRKEDFEKFFIPASAPH